MNEGKTYIKFVWNVLTILECGVAHLVIPIPLLLSLRSKDSTEDSLFAAVSFNWRLGPPT